MSEPTRAAWRVALSDRPADRRPRRRLGGTTGDVFGAIVEVTTATVLVACALVG